MVAQYDTPLLHYMGVVCRIIIDYALIWCGTPVFRYKAAVCRMIIDSNLV